MPNKNKDYKAPARKKRKSKSPARTSRRKKSKSPPKKKPPPDNNLNHRLSTSRAVPLRAENGTTFVRDDIAGFLERQLAFCDEAIICSPYISSATPLKAAFAKLKFTTVITAPAKALKTKAQQDMYLSWHADLYTLGTGSGKKKSIAHSKYIVGKKNGELVFATTGSYNTTGGSPSNIENIICFYDQPMMSFIHNECLQILRIARNII